jgi:hypothetical protein
VTWLYAFRGEPGIAFGWLDKAMGCHDTGVLSIPIDPLLSNLHDGPRVARDWR